GDRAGEATTLNNIGLVYSDLGEKEKALDYYNQALPLFKAVGDRAGEAATLSNMGFVYRDTNQPQEAIQHLEQSLNIILDLRKELKRENRKTFIESNQGTAKALTDLLIDQNQPQRAYEWINRVTTADLADYTRLIDAKVCDNCAAQTALDEWNKKNLQLQALRQQLEEDYSEPLAEKMREMEAQVMQEADTIGKQHPEIAELFETTPTDIAKLQASIPENTLVLHPVPLINAENVPESLALFLLTRDSLTVTKHPVNGTEFNQLLDQYRQQLANRKNLDYATTSQTLYNHLIQPIQDQIDQHNPQHLAIIATGKLRYLPFETLQNPQTKQYLLQQYPIHYLTRLSSRSATPSQLPITPLKALTGVVFLLALITLLWGKKRVFSGGVLLLSSISGYFLLQPTSPQVLALGNPVPEAPYNLPGAEQEVQVIAQQLKESEVYIREAATLDTFKKQAPRFTYLHLATHGCFQPFGCCLQEAECDSLEALLNPDIEGNSVLFAEEQFNLADAALLGLENTDLITLSACQTAQGTNADGIEISGLAYVLERAGAEGVIASLWSVDDKATQAIMSQFYQNLNQGMNKAEAMRQAKLSQLGDNKTTNHPFFWSPLILIGEP
ncbi:CHAT domain-containing protein, partial [Spirulina sp. CS-785/01]|uniref:CHAT domain-containing protein n=1 Tax=Spirulina sp. CS-785/01 TaxID=3021716 RepID=UPI0023314419